MEEKYVEMIINNTKSIESIQKDIERIEGEIKNIKELTVAVKEIAFETRKSREDINDINDRLKDVESKPAKNWNDLVSKIFACIVTAVMTFLLAKFGL